MNNNTQKYTSLDIIRAKKQDIRNEIALEESYIKRLWDKVFHREELSKSPTKRMQQILSTSMSIADGAIFGWKLYRKLRKF